MQVKYRLYNKRFDYQCPIKLPTHDTSKIMQWNVWLYINIPLSTPPMIKWKLCNKMFDYISISHWAPHPGYLHLPNVCSRIGLLSQSFLLFLAPICQKGLKCKMTHILFKQKSFKRESTKHDFLIDFMIRYCLKMLNYLDYIIKSIWWIHK